jgi:peptidoglycan-associated lipoprotein
MSPLKISLLAGLLAAGFAACGSAQVAPPAMVAVDPVKADFMARTGSDVVYFAGTGHLLDASARTTLTAQAQWLLANPTIQVRIEGHSDLADTRDHALAVGKRRADSVRDFLLLNGVPAAQVTAVSFGKERPATNGPGEAMAALNRRAVTVLVR